MAGFEQLKMADFDVLSPGGIVGSTGIYRGKFSILAVSNQFRHLPVEYSTVSAKRKALTKSHTYCAVIAKCYCTVI